MKSCHEMEALIAASLYEPLDDVDQAALDAHLHTCAACTQGLEGMRELVGSIPAEPIPFTGDLRMAVRADVQRQRSGVGRRRWTYGLSLAACFVFVFIGVYQFELHDDFGDPPEVVAMAVSDIVASARALAANGDAIEARQLLETGMTNVSDRDERGQLALELAGLEYDGFGRYGVAYEIYATVRSDHNNVWVQSDGRVKERFDLLTEARDANFEPLYAIDAARKLGEQGIPALEDVMVRYQGGMLASNALSTMTTVIGGEGVGALESLKSRCTNPIAVAQLDVRLGEGYWVERQDRAKGRELLETVAEGPHEVPAKMASTVLARLEADER